MSGQHMRFVALAISILIATSFAGCADEAPAVKEVASTTAAPPSVTAETGSISGKVVDEEQVPLVNAEVALIEGELKTTTDEAGQFTFNDLAPGPHKVVAQKLGYNSHAKSVNVVVGEVASVTLLLAAIEIIEAYHDTLDFNGMFVCGVSSPAVVLTPCRSVPEEKSTFTHRVKADAMTYIDAMTWQSTAPGTSKVLRNAVSIASPGSGSANVNGPSPNIARIDEPKTKADNAVNHVIWIGYTGTGDPLGVIAIAIQQKFHVLTSVFYGLEAPEDYTGLPEE